MFYYIVYFENKGYYVCYQDKIDDKYSDNFIEAKRYITLSNALNRARLEISMDNIKKLDIQISNNKRFSRRKKLKKLNNENFEFLDEDFEKIDILETDKFIEIVEVTNESIKKIRKVTNKEIYDFCRKKLNLPLNTIFEFNFNPPTEEEIDDFCSAIDSTIKKNSEKEIIY